MLGGGIRASGSGDAALTVTRSTIAGNRAPNGGGIHQSFGGLVLVNITVAANRAAWFGGGIYSHSGARILLNAVTIARNVAGADPESSLGGGGGIFRDLVGAGRGLVSDVTVENSLLGLNRLGSGQRNDCAGDPLGSLGHNLVSTLGPATMGSSTSCKAFDRPTDRVRSNPRIGRLKRNGGRTQTIALRKRSPAINRAKRSTAPNRDQRGKHRGRKRDIGAYERDTRR